MRHRLQLYHPGAVAESADATDLKSVDGDIVRVRPPPAPQSKTAVAHNLIPIKRSQGFLRALGYTQRESNYRGVRIHIDCSELIINHKSFIRTKPVLHLS